MMTFFPRLARMHCLRLVNVCVIFLLLSCSSGGGVGSGGTGLASSGSQFGAINGFGSVIVESNRYDDSIAKVTIEEDPASPRTVSNAELRLGMQVEVTFDSSERALTIRAIPSLVGRIDSLTASTMLVAGQTVLLTGTPAIPLVLDGASSLADLSVGDRVVVYGKVDATDRLLATRIEKRAGTQAAVTRVSGSVSSVAPAQSSFVIGGLAVAVNSATVRQPTGFVLAVGQKLTVWASADPASGALTASTLKLDPEEALADAPWRSAGVIRDLASATKTLRLGDVKVDYSTATFVGGTIADLANGKIVRVKGVARAGVLLASEIGFTVVAATVDDDDRTDSSGTVTDYQSALSFRVRGTAHSLLATAEIRGGVLSLLRDGAKVRVRGRPVGNVVYVERLEFLD
jgi:Domain of unknown function (DUF5666)